MTASLDCTQLEELAPELALGLTSGPERASALAHLPDCLPCRRRVEELSKVVDDLLLAGPTVEPPVGFETVVMNRLVAAQPGSVPLAERRRRLPGLNRWLLAAATVLVTLAVGAMVLALRSSGGSSGGPVRAAAMITPQGRTVGRIEIGAKPGSVFVVMPGWQKAEPAGAKDPYRLRLTFTDGHVSELGPIDLPKDQPSWGTATGFDTGKVRQVTMLDAGGRNLCSASIPV